MVTDHLFIAPLSGAMAGLTVDVALYPLDTIKTRLQTHQGFLKAGGFKLLYKGVGPAVAGSAPSAALFFLTYELMKSINSRLPEHYIPFLHMFAATMGEMVSNIARVPFEVVKQRSQANVQLRPLQILREIVRSEGLMGFYRGYLTTISREIPFSFLQYPIWEYLKMLWSKNNGGVLEPWHGAVCGAIAGGTAAAVTTPLDVAKTRVMLAKVGELETVSSIPKILLSIGRQEGLLGLFAGFVPRVCWISAGGFIFLGAYEKTKHTLMQLTS